MLYCSFFDGCKGIEYFAEKVRTGMVSPVKRGFLDLCEEICVFTTTETCALWFLALWFFYDNRDNWNNRKNGRNGGCHEVTYNKDNRHYSAPDGVLPLVVFTPYGFLRQHRQRKQQEQRVSAKKVSVDACNRVGMILS